MGGLLKVLACTGALTLALVACGPNSTPAKTDPAVNWGALPRSVPAIYSAGKAVSVAQASIGAGGGSLSGPAGTPVAGVVVTFPPDAVTQTTTFSIGYEEGGSFANLSAADKPLVVLTLTSSGQHEFKVPISVRFPFPDTTRVPVTYHIDDDGHLHLMPPLGLDKATGTAGFVTYHLSTYVPFQPADPNQSQTYRTDFPIFSGFFPDVNGFAFSNMLEHPYAPHGRCEGMVSFATWYKANVGEGLIGKFMDKVATKTNPKTTPTAQEVLAMRAHLSTYLKDPAITLYEKVPKTIENPDGKAQIGLSANITALQHALHHGPVVIGLLASDSNHAVLAIGINDTEIGIYDPNYPRMIKQIQYAFDPKEPHDEGATMKYSNYTYFGLWGNGELPQRAEKFEDILKDADQKFQGENMASIEITSPSSTKVDTADVTVQGKIHSGYVLISEMDIKVIYEDTSESEPVAATLTPGTNAFSAPLKLRPGDNRVVFITRGMVVGGDGGIPTDIPNDRGTNVDEDNRYILHWEDTSAPINSLSIQYARTETTDTKKIESSVHLSTKLTYYQSSILPAAIARDKPAFSFDQCKGYQNCNLVSAMSVDKVPFVSGDNLTILVMNAHTDTFEKNDKGEWELKSSVDSEFPQVSCQWIGVDIVVDPGSSAGNYSYRLVLSSGGNIQCPGMKAELPFLGQSLTQQGPMVGDLTCIKPPLLAPSAIEPWVTKPTGPKSWSLTGLVNCQNGGTTVTENASVNLTLVPCGGAPCLLP